MKKKSKTKKKNKTIQKIVGKKDFIIVHWNCNGIFKKIDELILFINKYKPDIISLNEIKCNNLQANYILNIDNYNYTHKTIENNRGGGIALLIKNNINFEIIDSLDHFKCEIISIKIELNNNVKLHLFH